MEYIRKLWTGVGDGRVVEYYHLKPPYDQANLSDANVRGNDISIVTVEGEVTQGVITPGSNKWIQDKPYEISYTLANNRWLIRDEDGDGKYEKKRQILESAER